MLVLGPWRVVEERIRSFIEEYNPKYVYVFISGGKDSTAVAAAAANCCKDRTVYVYTHIVGNTILANSRVVLEFAKRYGLRLRTIVALRAGAVENILSRDMPRPGELLYIIATGHGSGLDFWRDIARLGVPVPAERFGKGKRWCANAFKQKWWRELPASGVYQGKLARFMVVGVKRADSFFRKRNWKGKTIRIFYDRGLDVALAPIIDFNNTAVWMVLEHYGLKDLVKRQYDIYGHSPNCTICPIMGTEKMRKTVERLPEGYARYIHENLCKAREKIVGPVQRTLTENMLRVFRDVWGLECREDS